jgi:predicted alpha/beta hydrolase family esterase
MAYFENSRSRNDQPPLILLVPGLNDSGPDHWQTHWERGNLHAQRVDLGMWDDPHRNTWVNKLNLAIYRAERPVVLVAHSLGCLTVAWWAEYEQPGPDSGVIGALLVAPPDVDRPGLDVRLARFGACPRGELPFPSVLVASQDDPYCSQATAISLARDWGSRFADAGAVGHINAASGLGDWPLGQRLLEQLLRGHGPLPREIPAPRLAAAQPPAVASIIGRRH